MSLPKLALFLGAAAAVLILAGIASNVESIDIDTTPRESQIRVTGREPIPENLGAVERGTSSPPEEREPQDASLITIVIAAFAGAGVLWFLSKQRIKVMLRRRSFQSSVESEPLSEEEHAEAVATFADTLIDDLRHGGDAGEAIQRSYAAVETGFGTRELKRKPAETPLKYLDRVFGRHKAAAEPLGTLTDLFQVARFSQEPVTEDMRTSAIDSLVSIRDYYASVGRKRVRRS